MVIISVRFWSGKAVSFWTFYAAPNTQKVSDPSLKQIFLELANEEKNHRLILEGFLNHPSKPLKFSKVVDYKIADTINSPILSIDMKPADAIALAIKKEEEAMNV
ncbi:MAG TPA: ferritin family protein, partial [Anaerolineaceae bacterium]|nr:ferritin family protein [Anaerolineaceae bacterium]